MAVVVDTNVVSLIFKQDSRSLLYKPHLDSQFMILSFMTMAELRRWALASNWSLTMQQISNRSAFSAH